MNNKMFSILIIPLLMAYLPINDQNIKMQIGIIIGEIIARGYFLKQFNKILSFFKKRSIIIPSSTADMHRNPLFDKVQDYLATKFASSIESCELIPKNGDIEFNLSDMAGKIFHDTYNKQNFDLSIETAAVPINKDSVISTTALNIVIKSKTATPIDIKEYVKYITTTKNKDSNVIAVYRPLIHGKKKDDRYVEWDSILVKTNKTLSNTIYSKEVETELFDDIHNFMNNEDLYAERGIPYKRGYFLYSTPGQGKTSVAKIIANKYGMPVFCLDLTTVDDNALLTKLMIEISYYSNQEKYILLIEDIDRTSIINSRHYDRLTMDCFLNAIDGVAEPHGRILIISANDPTNVLDNKALMRPGRIDKAIEFHNCDSSQIQRLYSLFYKNHTYCPNWLDWKINQNLSAAYVIKLLQTNENKPEVFLSLVGDCVGDSNIDDETKKEIEHTKQNNRAKQNNRTNSINTTEHRIRRTIKNIKINEKRITRTTKELEASKNKLPIFLEKLAKEKQEKILKKRKERAARLTRKSAISESDSDSELNYETPNFIANSTPLDEIRPGTITTYVMNDD
jgi:hypothetical protein